LQRAVADNIERSAFQTKLGECYIEQQQYDAAERALLAALTDKPDAPMAHYDLGLIHEARGEPAKAIVEYQAEVARNPKTYQAQFNLAKLLSAAGRKTEAIAHFEKAVDANPAFGSGYLYLAKARLDVDDLDGAETAAIAGIKLKPGPDIAPLGHYVLSDVYSRRGRLKDAEREAAEGRKLEQRRAS
jgi:tetratricopeptide (TPR) repeat protein